ncbi:MAG TPA: phospholipase D-like domain-containing protein [Blastocatellia bacterium]|nr:phospholipase D-like domain-containing protein [Blastocatellia bacterium]
MEAYTKVQNLSLIVQPGDSFFPIVDAIDSATTSIKMTIFRMNDPIVLEAMTYAVSRGVRVQALVAPASKGWTKRNKRLSEELSKVGIEVTVPRARKEKIKRYHYKIMTIDNKVSLILTFNPTQKNLHYARDLGLLIRDQEIATELSRLFDADWSGESFKPRDLPLLISPYNSRQKMIELLSSAERTIRILDAKVQDQQAIGLLLRKASIGCSIKIIGEDTSYDEVVPNYHVRKLARYKLHAKCIVVDGSRFFIGSQNIRPVSLDRRREVGLIVEDDAMARKIERVFDEDWDNATDMRTVTEGAARDA